MTRRKHVQAAPVAGPEGILPTTDFRDDPFGDGRQMVFRGGVMSSSVPAEFAREMREKGLAAPKQTVSDQD